MTTDSNSALPWWRRIRRRFFHVLLLLVLGIAGRLSLKHGRFFGRTLARLGVFLRPTDRKRALGNIALAFPEMDSSGRDELFKGSVLALGENFHDSLAAPGLLLRENMVQEKTSRHQRSLLEELRHLHRKDRGILILTGHLGCWELLGGWMASQVENAGLGQLAVVTGSIHNGPVDDLLQQRRLDLGMKTLPRLEGAAPLLRHLRNGGIAAVLLDQNTRVENRMVPFFGQDAPTPIGFGRIALRYGVPVLPMAIARRGNTHEVLRGRPWMWDDSGENDQKALGEFLIWCNNNLEKFIRRNPMEWVWFHNRWQDPEKTGHRERG